MQAIVIQILKIIFSRGVLEELAINTRNWVDSAQDRHYLRAHVNVALKLESYAET